MSDPQAGCSHRDRHPCGWTQRPGDHTCPNPLPGENTDPPFWRAVEPISDDFRMITYRCNACGRIDSIIINSNDTVISATAEPPYPPLPPVTG